MSMIENFEEEFLKDSDVCECGTKLEAFKKFTSGTEFMWIGWCPKCNQNRVKIHGSNPND